MILIHSEAENETVWTLQKSLLILLLSCGQLSHSELKPTVYNTIIMSSNRQQVRTARPWNTGNPTQPPLPCPTPFNGASGLFGFVTRWHCKNSKPYRYKIHKSCRILTFNFFTSKDIFKLLNDINQ